MFSAPLWLFGLFALLIPLVLHLWSRKPRQVIRVGTLRHVELTADARSWSARLTEPLLLAVRLALLATIVFALAGLRLPTRSAAGSGSELVLIDPRLQLEKGDSLIDSLTRSRAQARLLLPGLRKVTLGDTLSDERYTRPDIWAALVEADRLVGPGGTLHVIARPQVASLRGPRPRIRAKLVWHAPADLDSSTWSRSWRGGDSSVFLEASGDRRGVVYSLRRVAGRCDDGCNSAPLQRVQIETGGDSGAARRIALAVRAISTELLLPVEIAPSGTRGEFVITTLPLSDSLLQASSEVITLSAAAIADGSLVDSIWARWHSPVLRDLFDRREVSIAQALASRPIDAPAPLGDPEGTRRALLVLALFLFVIERWLATRPGRTPA